MGGIETRVTNRWQTARWLAVSVLVAAVALSVMTAVALRSYGSLGSALAALDGQPLVLDTYFIDVGTVVQGDERRPEVRVSNHSNKTIRILGARASCVCAMAEELPVELVPGGTAGLRLRLKTRTAKFGPFRHGIDLYTDCQDARVVRLSVTGRVVGSPRADGAGVTKERTAMMRMGVCTLISLRL